MVGRLVLAQVIKVRILASEHCPGFFVLKKAKVVFTSFAAAVIGAE